MRIQNRGGRKRGLDSVIRESNVGVTGNGARRGFQIGDRVCVKICCLNGDIVAVRERETLEVGGVHRRYSRTERRVTCVIRVHLGTPMSPG
jgi:hypothetical protein